MKRLHYLWNVANSEQIKGKKLVTPMCGCMKTTEYPYLSLVFREDISLFCASCASNMSSTSRWILRRCIFSLESSSSVSSMVRFSCFTRALDYNKGKQMLSLIISWSCIKHTTIYPYYLLLLSKTGGDWGVIEGLGMAGMVIGVEIRWCCPDCKDEIWHWLSD